MSKQEYEYTHEQYTSLVDEGVYPPDPDVPLPPAFKTDFGTIKNLILKPIQSVAVIESVRGSVRANHYHKTDWHYAYVVRGKVLYFERGVGEIGLPDAVEFFPGQMFFTPPMREHAMVFVKDTTIFTFAKNVR